MVFFGSLSGSNTVSVDTLTTTGLVSASILRIGPSTTVNEEINRFYYGFRSGVTGVTDSGVTLVTITVSGMPSTVQVFVTPYYGGAATFPSLYARVYDVSSGSFRVAMRVDDETPGTFTAGFYWVVID